MQNRPELSALQQLLQEALQNRGRQVRVAWRSPGTGAFTLVLVCNLRGDPRWCLYREQQGKTDLVFDYSSCDVLLVMNLITSSLTETQKSTRSPFLSKKVDPGTLPTNAEIDAIEAKYAALKAAGLIEEPGVQPVASSLQEETGQPGPSSEEETGAQPASSPEEAKGAQPGPSSQAKAAPSSEEEEENASLEVAEPEAASVPITIPAITTPSFTTPDDSQDSEESLLLNARTIDGAAIQSVMTSLRRTDTGMFIFPAFLYFLEQEFFRSLRARVSLSVIVFEMREEFVVDGKTMRGQLPTGAIVDAVLRITQLKRQVDLIAHYGDSDYAILLPNTRSAGARAFAERVIALLREKPLGDVNPDELTLAFGCASIPEDFVDMGKLLGAAELAVEQARSKESKLVIYGDIKDRVKIPE